MSQHTPGPWKVCQGSVFTRYYVKAVHATYVVAECGISEGKTGEANARLIAAAPELLALAKQYARECAYCSGSGAIQDGNHGGDPRAEPCSIPCEGCHDIRAVIHAAEGR